MKSKIVVSIMPKTIEEIEYLKLADYQEVDLIEWRADFLPQATIMQAAPLIFEKFSAFDLIFTIRTAREGGNLDIPIEDYVEINRQMLKFNPTYIDLEYFSYPKSLEILSDFKKQIVLSYHNFTEMPADLNERMIEMLEQETALIKLAIMPQNNADVLDLMSLTSKMTEKYGRKFVTMAMGDRGRLSRIAGSLSDSQWTFASLGEASAPGQVNLKELRQIIDLLEF